MPAGELTEYYKAMQDMDVSFSQDNLARQQSVEETKDDKPSATPQKTFKPKSFTEIVRLQRPDRTRKQPNKFALNSAGRVQSVSQSETSRTSVRTQTSQREQEMIRGKT
ncbi:hypothetical protein DPMN_157278 [Dreissena polymorpha]|uniref:Uncharacterized protein n=1 Tax=Dreissena polymorpha TaxID=45954 RepID=A0A9D4EK16_DREPO|nr:hypothetical protein DPMN_157278 [Dreissena polymorpha]